MKSCKKVGIFVVAFLYNAHTIHAQQVIPVLDSSTYEAEENIGSSYNRRAFSSGWKDEDSDCQSTRTEVLIRDSLVDVVLSESGCSVRSGLWIDPYLGKIIRNVKSIDIDHIVPLKEVFDSGGYKWSKKQKNLYANDLDVLIVTHRSSNRSKKSKSPQEWMPSNRAYWGTYLSKWVDIKNKYNLTYDVEEYIAIRKLWVESYSYLRGDAAPLSCINNLGDN